QFDAHLLLVVLVKLFKIALHEGRFHCSGADGVDAQGLGIFDGKLAGHGNHRALGGAVGEALLDANLSGDGGDVDDCAGSSAGVFGSKKQGQKSASDEIDSADVDVDQAVEVLRLGGFNGADVADARIVDQDVEPTDVLYRSGDGVGAGDVEVNDLRRGEGRGEGFGCGEINVGDPDEGASGDEFLHGCFADAAGAAGDKGVTAVETKRLRWIGGRC